MSVWISLLLGIVQGATEFLPVSSSGHLSIFQALFSAFGAELPSLEELVLFDVLLHFATLTAVFVAFRKDIKELIYAFFSFSSLQRAKDEKGRPARRLLLLILIATIPILAVAPFSGTVERLKENLHFIGGALLLTGILLTIADKLPKGKRNEKTARVSDAAAVGLMQAIAVIPGLSRSGSTIWAGLMRDFDRQFAIKFSFLMSIPAILGATVLHIAKDLKGSEETMSDILSYIPGMLAAAVVGYFAIILLKRMAERGRFGAFALYCFAVGIITVFLPFILG